MAGLVADLTARHSLRGKRILELGCGQGDFLTLLCATSGARGVGYDTAYRGPRTRLGGRVRFEARYVSAADIRERFDLVVCRHVVEHVAEIGAFLAGLRAIAARCGGAVTMIETPDFEWTARNACFWDVFYEHCNYFTRPTLAYLCRRAGLSVARHRRVFGGQYQLLELDVARAASRPRRPRRPVELTRFAHDAEAAVASLERRLVLHGARHGMGGLGGGSEGRDAGRQASAPPAPLRRRREPREAGLYHPGHSSTHRRAGRIRGCSSSSSSSSANPNYATEIESTVRSLGYNGTVLAA